MMRMRSDIAQMAHRVRAMVRILHKAGAQSPRIAVTIFKTISERVSIPSASTNRQTARSCSRSSYCRRRFTPAGLISHFWD
jgi:hypothetical protein